VPGATVPGSPFSPFVELVPTCLLQSWPVEPGPASCKQRRALNALPTIIPKKCAKV